MFYESIVSLAESLKQWFSPKDIPATRPVQDEERAAINRRIYLLRQKIRNLKDSRESIKKRKKEPYGHISKDIMDLNHEILKLESQRDKLGMLSQ